MKNLMYIIIAVLFIGWLLGEYVFRVRGTAINALLLAAIIMLAIKLVSGAPREYDRRGLR